MYRFVYRNKKTGRRVLSHTPKEDNNLVLLSGIKTTDIKRKDIEERKPIKKSKKK